MISVDVAAPNSLIVVRDAVEFDAPRGLAGVVTVGQNCLYIETLMEQDGETRVVVGFDIGSGECVGAWSGLMVIPSGVLVIASLFDEEYARLDGLDSADGRSWGIDVYVDRLREPTQMRVNVRSEPS